MPQNRFLNEEARRNRMNRAVPMVRCDQCGAEFVPYNHKARFCSPACAGEHSRISRRRTTDLPAKTCPECREQFNPATWSRQVYCTVRCRRSACLRRILKDPRRAAARKALWRTYSKSEAYRLGQKNHKARRRTAERKGDNISLADWKALVARFDGKCAYCRQELPLTMDHVKPLIKGGEHVLSNIVPACAKCNATKREHDWSDRLCL